MTTANRYLFVKQGCPFCKKYKAVREVINLDLKNDKRIQLIDVTSYSAHGIIMDSRAEAVIKSGLMTGVPMLYMDGFIVRGATSESFVKGWLLGYLAKTGELKD
jgi:glutaredoxin